MHDDRIYADDDLAAAILAMARVAAARVDSRKLEQLRADVQRQRERNGDQPYYLEWLRLIGEGPQAVARTLREESEHGRYLRSVVPLRSLITRDERNAIMHRVLGARSRSRGFERA